MQPIPGYHIEAVIGRGAMGTVYRAVQLAVRRRVALKILTPELRDDPVFRERFRLEAQAVAKLDHPGIVQLFEVGEAAGFLYYSMELVAGRTVADLLAAGLSPEQAATLARDAALAVAHAHARGIVHRDIKPQNILVDRENHPHILDFGLARDAARRTLTRTGASLGTPAYMSPEQVDPDGARRVADARVDVWGLGATLYEMLTGVPPFSGKNAYALAREILYEDPPRPSVRRPGVPAPLDAVVLQALEKDPARRYASAAALADDLDRFLGGLPVRARRPSALGRRLGRLLSGKVAAFIGVLLVAAAASIAGVLLRPGAGGGGPPPDILRALDAAVADLRAQASGGADACAFARSLDAASGAIVRAAQGRAGSEAVDAARRAVDEAREAWLRANLQASAGAEAGTATASDRALGAVAIVEAAIAARRGGAPPEDLVRLLSSLGGIGVLRIEADVRGRAVVRPAEGASDPRTVDAGPGAPAVLDLRPGRYVVTFRPVDASLPPGEGTGGAPLAARHLGPFEVEVPPAAAGGDVRIAIATVGVRTAAELHRALGEARPGTAIVLAPGTYEGSFDSAAAGVAILGPGGSTPAVIRGRLTVNARALVRGVALEAGGGAGIICGPRAGGTRLEDIAVRDGDPGVRVEASSVELSNVSVGVHPGGTGIVLGGPEPVLVGARVSAAPASQGASVGVLVEGADALIVDVAVDGPFQTGVACTGDRAFVVDARVRIGPADGADRDRAHGTGVLATGDAPYLASILAVGANVGVEVGGLDLVLGATVRHATAVGCRCGVRLGRLAVGGRVEDCLVVAAGSGNGFEYWNPAASSDRNLGPAIPAAFGEFHELRFFTLADWRQRTGTDALSQVATPILADGPSTQVALDPSSPGARTSPAGLDCGHVPWARIRSALVAAGSDERAEAFLDDIARRLTAAAGRPAVERLGGGDGERPADRVLSLAR